MQKTRPDSPPQADASYERQLLNLIPPDSAVVVELGAADGSLGGRYKRRNPAGRYVGVAADAAAAATAAAVLDQVIAADPASVSLEDAGFGPGTVDCLILRGSAVAGARPALRLRRLLESVSERGVLLLVVANRRNMASRRLQQGGAAARRGRPGGKPVTGTLRELQAICKRAGCKTVEIFGAGSGAQGASADENRAIQGRKKPPRCFIARIPAAPPRRRVLIQSLILPPIAACNDKRIHEPVTCLKTIPGVRAVTNSMQQARLFKPLANEARIFVWQRPILTRPKGVNRLRRLLAAGYLVITEFDDDPRRWQAIVDHDYLTFRGVHGVQTSTDLLADFLRQFNPHVAVFPNQMLVLPEKKTVPVDGVVRLFFGALNREGDWNSHLPALNRVLKEYGSGLHVTVIYDRVFFEGLETRHKTFFPLCDYRAFQERLRACDIGLLPLADTEFNRYRSDLKFIECAAHEVVALASTTVYASAVVDGKTGMLFHDAQEFEQKLRTLIAERELRRRIAENARQWVAQERMLGRYFRNRHEWYMQMLDMLPQLNRELRLRMPELF